MSVWSFTGGAGDMGAAKRDAQLLLVTPLIVVVFLTACAGESTQPDSAGDCGAACSDAPVDTSGDAGGGVHDAAALADADAATLPDAAADAPEPLDVADISQVPDTPDGSALPGPLTECPTASPTGDEECSTSLSCSYGQECCCGSCDVAYVCDCDPQDGMSCYYTDFCIGTRCSEGCGPQELATPLGCVSCDDAYAGARNALQELADSAGACVTDEDCQLAPTATTCGPVCDLAVAKAGAEALAAGALAINAAWCPDADWCGDYPSWMDEYWEQPACQAEGYPRCDAGECRFAVTCDPAVQAVGSPCDDGDACTVGDVCTGPFVCSGLPDDCDDDDPCTDDACDPSTGCAHTDTNAACPGFEDTCTVGGQCFFGVCQANPVPGFTRAYPGPHRVVRAVAAVPGGGGALVLAGLEGNAPSATGFVLRLDALGQPSGPPMAFAPVADVLAYEDGGLLLTGEVPGQKTDIALTRVGPEGEALWTSLIEAPGNDSRPQLAAHPSGAAAVVWTHAFIPETHVATISVTGELGPTVSLGAAADLGSWPGEDGWPRVVHTTDGFAVAHTTTSWSGTPRVKVSLIDLTGAVTSAFVLGSPENEERPRGILWLDGDVLVVWGVRGAGAEQVRWVRRLSITGEQEWETVGRAEEVAPMSSVVLWTYGVGADGVPRLANIRIDTGEEVWSQLMPPTDAMLTDSAKVPDGIALAGTLLEDGVAHPWLRRTSWVQDCDGGVCPPPGCAAE